MILALALVPLVTGLPQHLVYPYQVVGSSYQTVGSTYPAIRSTYPAVGSTFQVVGSHYPVQRSPLLQTGFPYLTSDIIQQTRQQTDSLKVILRNLAQNPTSAKYIRRVLDSGSCIDSLEEAIGAIEAGVKLVENAGPEIQGLVATVKSLENERDIEKLVKISANALRQLEVVIPKIAPSSPTVCGASAEATFEALQNIAQILNDVSEDESLYLSELNKSESHLLRRRSRSEQYSEDESLYLSELNKNEVK